MKLDAIAWLIYGKPYAQCNLYEQTQVRKSGYDRRTIKELDDLKSMRR